MISPGLGAEYADTVAEVYRDAELRILQRIARALEQGIDAPGWEQLQLARLQVIRAEVLEDLATVNPEAAQRILQSLNDAYARGSLSAMADVRGTIDPLAASTGARRRAVARLAADTVRGITSGQSTILRRIDDVVRSVVADATASVLAGGESRREATQRALAGFLAKGITSIDTKRGQMSLSTYTNMAVRTATARGALQGHEDSMDEMGLDLVIIHPGPRACKICDEWARAILSRSGRAGLRWEANEMGATKPRLPVVVRGSLDDARSAGWGHPNCRCGMNVYIPGVTKPEEIQRPPWDEAGYKAQQQQRGIERQIRGWKEREAIAMTPQAKLEAKARVAGWQGQMRGHMERHPDLKRQSKREQITGTFRGNADAARSTRRPPDDRPPGSPRRKTPPGSPKIAEPASTTPKLDQLKRFDDAKNLSARVRGTNPLQAQEKGYQVNCTHCVSTMELRARGYNVTATPIATLNGQPTNDVLRKGYRTTEGEVRLMELQRGKTGLERTVRDEWPEGARGFVSLQWKGARSGHVFTVAKENGKAVYYEPQRPDGSRDPAGYFADARPGTIQLVRTDDLVVLDDALEYSQEYEPGIEGQAKAANAARAKRQADFDKLNAELGDINQQIAALNTEMNKADTPPERKWEIMAEFKTLKAKFALIRAKATKAAKLI